MFTKKVIFLLVIVLCMGTIVLAQSKGTIVYTLYPGAADDKIDPETGEYPDMPFVYLLEDAGYEVIIFYNGALSTAEPATLDTLYNCNLIIMGRSTPSQNYLDDKDIWNNITTPTLCLEMWAIRSSRLNWLNTTAINSITVEDVTYNAIIDVPDDPVFEGLDTSAPVPWIYGPYDAMGVSEAGYGTVLARFEADSNIVFVRWEADEEFYPGSVDVPAGPRTMIGNGRDNGGNAPFDYYNFTLEGEQVFLAEVERMVILGGGGSAVAEHENTTPATFALSQNYPNPFNPSTTIPFDLPEKSHVRLSLSNILGEEITEIVNQEYSAGHHEMVFNAGDLAAGIYFYRIETDGFSAVKKLALIK